MDVFELFQPPKLSPNQIRSMLSKFDKSKILEIYFSRMDGHLPDTIPAHVADIYSMDVEDIKEYLITQKPVDPLITKVLSAEF